MVIQITCEYCKRIVNKKSIKRHLLSKVCLLSRNIDVSEALTPCSKCNKLLTIEGHHKHKCVRKVRSDKKSEDVSKDRKIILLTNKVDKLIEQVEKLSQTNIINSNNTINNNINVNNYILVTEKLFEEHAEKITFQDLVNGPVAIADVTLKYLKPGTITTTDRNRKVMRYNDENGKEVVDDGGEHIFIVVCKGIKTKVISCYETGLKNIDIDNSDYEDNFEDNKKAGESITSIKNGAKGTDTNSRFAKDFTKRFAYHTHKDAPTIVNPDDSSNLESEVDSIKQDEVIHKIEETVEETDQEIYDRLVKLQPYSSTVYARSKYQNPECKEKYPKTYQYVMKYKNADDLVLNQSMSDYSRYIDSESDSD